MSFKKWLNEDIHRTGTQVVNYPPQYDGHPYDYMGVPIFHTSHSASYITWLTLQVKPFKWKNYEEFAAKDGERLVNTWEKIFLSAPQNYGTGDAAVKQTIIDRLRNV
jgi:hypothetical protein